jgi:hypothetical protein
MQRAHPIASARHHYEEQQERTGLGNVSILPASPGLGVLASSIPAREDGID